MFPEVAQRLVGDLGEGVPAELDGYARFEATTRSWANYPYITRRPGESVNGLLLPDVSPNHLKKLDWFEDEGALYDRVAVDEIRIGGAVAKMNVWIYVIGAALASKIKDYAERQQTVVRETPWDPVKFRKNEIDAFLKRVVIPAVESAEFRERFVCDT